MLKRAFVCTVSVLAVVAALAQEGVPPAQTSTLAAGAKAPPLSVEKWVKGSPVKEFEKGKIYVVEFWATWCGPCIASMPHLSDIQKEYGDKGVTVIGVTSVDPNNSREQVEKMVKEKGDTMGYTVAWDKERSTNEAYMKAANQNGIPTSFLIDGAGTIAWIGHPMFLDIPLVQVIAGKWDPKSGPDLVKKAQDAFQGVFMKMRTSPKDALPAWDAFEKDYPKLAHQFADQKFTALLAAGEYDRAYKLGAELTDKAIQSKDAEKLNQVAWTIVDPEGKVEKRDLDLAMKAAVKADEITEGKNAAIIDTLARVYFLKGDAAKALELQKKAVSLATGAMKAELERALKEYEAAQQK
jgi:thiol-disulfide isomerase/thioredoxin